MKLRLLLAGVFFAGVMGTQLTVQAQATSAVVAPDTNSGTADGEVVVLEEEVNNGQSVNSTDPAVGNAPTTDSPSNTVSSSDPAASLPKIGASRSSIRTKVSDYLSHIKGKGNRKFIIHKLPSPARNNVPPFSPPFASPRPLPNYASPQTNTKVPYGFSNGGNLFNDASGGQKGKNIPNNFANGQASYSSQQGIPLIPVPTPAQIRIPTETKVQPQPPTEIDKPNPAPTISPVPSPTSYGGGDSGSAYNSGPKRFNSNDGTGILPTANKQTTSQPSPPSKEQPNAVVTPVPIERRPIYYTTSNSADSGSSPSNSFQSSPNSLPSYYSRSYFPSSLKRNNIDGPDNDVRGGGNIIRGKSNLIDGLVNQIQGDDNGVCGDANCLKGHVNYVHGTSNKVNGENNLVQGHGNIIACKRIGATAPTCQQ